MGRRAIDRTWAIMGAFWEGEGGSREGGCSLLSWQAFVLWRTIATKPKQLDKVTLAAGYPYSTAVYIAIGLASLDSVHIHHHHHSQRTLLGSYSDIGTFEAGVGLKNSGTLAVISSRPVQHRNQFSNPEGDVDPRRISEQAQGCTRHSIAAIASI